ncbi:uncharacterized protein LOC121412573 [Lytechinus variegatus]|uniref:uncharacterized protein LOC121412573 n=1 Tax=Lytechinus variegatus TaxID=7654 RepID=UPI001BB2CAB0|nr:uncharacterized protein LOC121412573 [Lytechinus variegatus]
MADAKRSRLFFICIPRSGSTSILKCLSFIDGLEAWFEPYVIAKIAIREYKAHAGKDLPTDWKEENRAEFDHAAQLIHNMNKLPLVEGKDFAFSEVKRRLENLESAQVVVKDMGGSFFGSRKQYLPSRESGYKYVFIIRDPQLAMSSYRRATIQTSCTMPGYTAGKTEEDFDLRVDDPYYYAAGGNYFNIHAAWKYVRENFDPDPLIVDCEDLMANPKPYLQKICEVGGLEFHDGLLNWDTSTDIIKTWKNPGGVPKMLATGLGYFHRTAINSSCFQFSKKEKPPLSSATKDIQRAVADGTEYYNEMYELRFKP